jgi:hypothetical protein
MPAATLRKPEPEQVSVDERELQTPTILIQEAPPAEVQDREAVARLAYAFWEERARNGMPGSPDEDWLRAEHALRESI